MLIYVNPTKYSLHSDTVTVEMYPGTPGAHSQEVYFLTVVDRETGLQYAPTTNDFSLGQIAAHLNGGVTLSLTNFQWAEIEEAAWDEEAELYSHALGAMKIQELHGEQELEAYFVTTDN